MTEQGKLRTKLTDLNRKLSELLREIQRTEKQLDRNGEDVYISDHAVIRYLERVHGIDIEKLRNSILTEQQKAMIRAGACAIRSGRFTYKVQDRAVTTIIGER